MLYAGILPGDYVVVHQQEHFRNGEIVVALFEDEATVKTLRRKDGHVWLMPENPEYQPIDGDGAQAFGQGGGRNPAVRLICVPTSTMWSSRSPIVPGGAVLRRAAAPAGF